MAANTGFQCTQTFQLLESFHKWNHVPDHVKCGDLRVPLKAQLFYLYFTGQN